MTSQQYQDTYILVPRSSVSAPNSESKIQEKTDSKVTAGSSSAAIGQSAGAETNSTSVSIYSSKLFGGRNSGRNDAAQTYLTVTGSMALSISGVTSATHSINPWQCSEWTQFSKVFQEYEVLSSTIVWDNHQLLSGVYQNASGTATTAMFNYGASCGTAGSTDLLSSVTTWNQFVDTGDFKVWDYGPSKNTCTRTWKPKGCLVYNGATGFYTMTKGYQPTIYGENHTWGRHHFMSSGTMTGSSTIVLRWVVRYKVRFRGRKDA